MADTDEDCDSWRNRDKYQKEREPSVKANSPSPVNTKTEKRQFNKSQSPPKVDEPPFKRQRNDSGYNNTGDGNFNRRDNSENRRDNFNNRRGGFDNRRGDFNGRRGDFNNRRGNFDNQRDNFDNRRDSFDNRKGSFDNRRDNFDNRRDNFDNRRDNFDNRRDNFDSRRDNFDNRRDNFDNRRDNFDNRRDNYDNKRDYNDNNRDTIENKREFGDNRYSGANAKSTEDAPNYQTQPQLLLFKQFLLLQDDDIDMQVAMSKYSEYKDTFVKKQLKAFFDSHCTQEWFKEKYHPSYQESNQLKEKKNIASRKAIFTFLYENHWMDNIKLHLDETDSIVRLMDAVVILLEGGNENDLKILDSRRYRSESPNEVRNLEKNKENPKPSIENVVKADVALESLVKVAGSHDDLEKTSNEMVNYNDIADISLIDDEEAKESLEEKNEVVLDVGEPTISVVESSEDITEIADNKEETLMNNNKTPSNIEDEEAETTLEEPRALHKTFSIFLRNLHPDVLRSEIEAIVKPYDGYLRLALQDPTPERKFFRRGWVTYDRNVNIKEICWNLNNVRLHDCDIGAIVNRDLSQRVRPVHFLTNHKPVMRQDLQMAVKMVTQFDKKRNLWFDEAGNYQNHLLKNLAEYLVEECSSEEEALLGKTEPMLAGSDQSSITIEMEDSLAMVLDRLILYLRFVHSYDYYGNTDYQIEDEMPHKCGLIHVRGISHGPLSAKDIEEYMSMARGKAEAVLGADLKAHVTTEEAVLLGLCDPSEATEALIAANTVEVGPEKWLCPLSGKKFRGPAFVRKHLMAKHADKLQEASAAAVYFNNYLMDARRPRLPEHPSGAPAVAKGINTVVAEASSRPSGVASGGSYYRKTAATAPRIRNGDGSYYCRKLTSYEDLDAPRDD